MAVGERAGGPDAGDGPASQVGLQLARVGEVHHHGEVAPGGDDLLEEAEHVVGVAVGDEPLRPVGDRLGADADGVDGGHAQDRFEVAAQPVGRHDHGIAAGHEHVVDLGVSAQVVHQTARFQGGEAQVGIAHELCPAEAVGAIGVAGLPLSREVEHGLPVLVLEARHRFPVHCGDVELLLAGGVRVEASPDLRNREPEFLPRARIVHEGRQPVLVLGPEHSALREDHLEDGVVRDVVPVDELGEDVLVHAERKHRGQGPYGAGDGARYA